LAQQAICLELLFWFFGFLASMVCSIANTATNELNEQDCKNFRKSYENFN
jgi:hypothetical protein